MSSDLDLLHFLVKHVAADGGCVVFAVEEIAVAVNDEAVAVISCVD